MPNNITNIHASNPNLSALESEELSHKYQADIDEIDRKSDSEDIHFTLSFELTYFYEAKEISASLKDQTEFAILVAETQKKFDEVLISKNYPSVERFNLASVKMEAMIPAMKSLLIQRNRKKVLSEVIQECIKTKLNTPVVSDILNKIRAGQDTALINYLSDARINLVFSRNTDMDFLDCYSLDEFVDAIDGLNDEQMLAAKQNNLPQVCLDQDGSRLYVLETDPLKDSPVNRQKLLREVIQECNKTKINTPVASDLLNRIRAGQDTALKNYFSDVRINLVLSRDTDIEYECYSHGGFIEAIDGFNDEQMLAAKKNNLPEVCLDKDGNRLNNRDSDSMNDDDSSPVATESDRPYVDTLADTNLVALATDTLSAMAATAVNQLSNTTREVSGLLYSTAISEVAAATPVESDTDYLMTALKIGGGLFIAATSLALLVYYNPTGNSMIDAVKARVKLSFFGQQYQEVNTRDVDLENNNNNLMQNN